MNERQSVLEISTKAFNHNIQEIKKLIGPKKEIMYVMKANGYGTYLNKNINVIKDFNIIATAIVKEAVELRLSGFKNKIFVLNQPYVEDIENIINYDVTIGVADLNFIKELSKRKDKFTIHLELETGMGRTGISLTDLDEVLEFLKETNNIEVEGVYTHLSAADTDEDFTNKQMELFKTGVSKIKEYYKDIKYIHASASNGILNVEDDFCNLVRPGILLYGYLPSTKIKKQIDLQPVAKLKSRILFIKKIEKDTSISYGRTFISTDKMTIATIGIGYADGIRRNLSNIGKVIIDGKKSNMVGTICMDSFMADVTNIDNVKVGDYVYIWDNDKIKLEDIANQCNTISYEILSTISNRVPRVFVD